MGLYHCAGQDVINLYNVINHIGGHTHAPANLSVFECSQTFMIWNVPRCWQSLNIMLGPSAVATNLAKDVSSHGTCYKYDSESCFIGRGTFVFVVVVVYKCIHTPIQWM